ncbi:extracellular matrix protein 2 isoform X2 [Cololabis saira]|uniref:extracellular matrix protein 2 isoform X1 n=1 Tax=Cololabis saira TaxID=129043 RepID=UPI002AD24122|nr:extracellular matrix protein 2 isoform X1 [Cololabis saira]XP_061582579.1 extracellular matrix protein 2 isoform X2 [Cololabis saira]
MRWWLLLAGLGLLVQTAPHAEAQDPEGRRGRRNWAGLGRAEGGRPRALRVRPGPGPAEGGRPRPLRVRPGPGPAEGGRPRPPRVRPGPGPGIRSETHRDAGYLPANNNLYNVIPAKQSSCIYQGLTMFDQAVWSPKPCVTCRCSGGTASCQEISCPTMHCMFPFVPAGQCCPVCHGSDSLDFSGDSPVPGYPSYRGDPGYHGDTLAPLGPQEIQEILRREDEENRREEEEEARLRRKRRKQRKEQEEKRRKRRREEEEEALRLQAEKEEEDEWRRQVEEEERRRREEEERRRREEEEDRKKKERETREMERKLEEERRRQEERLREELLGLVGEEGEEEEEEEEEVWLRGDVFQMPPKEPEEPEEPDLDLAPAPIPRPPSGREEEEEEEEEEGEQEEEEERGNRAGLPPGCDISDVTVTCEKLSHFPPLNLPGLKSLSLEGNDISSIPAGAFNGIPNLEWINLKKNRLTSEGIHPAAFKGLKMLQRLYLDGNLLEVVPSDLPTTLQELKVSENRLRRVEENSFHGLSSLVTLELEGNLLSEATVDPRAFAPLSQLSYLRLGRNHFRTVPQGLPESLLEVYLENNLIEEVSDAVFNHTLNLNVVSLRHNKLDETRISHLAWISHRSLESIDLSHNQFYLVPSFLPRSLVHLVLVGNNIERIPGYVFAHMHPGLEYLYLSFNKLDGEGVESESFFGAYNSMVELCLDHNQLLNVPAGINEMTNLHFLRLDSNRIRSVPDQGVCDPARSGDAPLVALRLENNYLDPDRISPSAFSCVRSSSSVVLKPQRSK